MDIPKNISRKIQEYVESTYSGDLELQRHVAEEQIEGYRRFLKIDYGGLSKEDKEYLLKYADESTLDWGHLPDVIEEMVDSLIKYRAYDHPDISGRIMKNLKGEAESNLDRRWWLETLEEKVKRYIDIENVRREIDPIKEILVELERIVGSECYNDYLKSDGNWSLLEGAEQSFRYPVTFINSSSGYKLREVPESLPSEDLITGSYIFGANELSIYRALYKIVKHLEINYGLNLPSAGASSSDE